MTIESCLSFTVLASTFIMIQSEPVCKGLFLSLVIPHERKSHREREEMRNHRLVLSSACTELVEVSKYEHGYTQIEQEKNKE
jgi:hypothetical protein